MSKLVKVKDNAPSIKDKMKKDPTKVNRNGVGGGSVVASRWDNRYVYRWSLWSVGRSRSRRTNSSSNG